MEIFLLKKERIQFRAGYVEIFLLYEGTEGVSVEEDIEVLDGKI